MLPRLAVTPLNISVEGDPALPKLSSPHRSASPEPALHKLL